MSSEWLYEHNSGRTFAWTDNGRDFWRQGSGTWWAWRQGDWLYAAQGGQPLGWFAGATFYDHATGQALYYLDR
ncbi:4-fold beta flower protein [Streptosporangium lutulentum]|uniref:4-fold beta flower domain-containing protein n=1 Tax=Streptosporangium lutulentum TaxID=1461250 RepID=A0ABT9QU18_9ACTN|nr:hypothetical protein [Streptosporangium lutulentum]MDP9850268.1 hypothetical protein [Streptosporangium lutulentum]